MKKIIACVDGSEYTKNICDLSVWIAERTDLSISLLHVVPSHCRSIAEVDLSGQIGLGANADLIEELTNLDEEHGKLEQKKGQLILNHAKTEILEKGLSEVKILHRRGSLIDTITEMENSIEIVVMGKHGEKTSSDSIHFGSNIENIARSIHKPLLIATKNIKPIKRFLIAYDGESSSEKAVDYICSYPLLQGLECYLFTVGNQTNENDIAVKNAKNKLTSAGFKVQTMFFCKKSVSDAIDDSVKEYHIDLLLIGAYNHSKIRSFILGSTTKTLIEKSKIPLLMFK